MLWRIALEPVVGTCQRYASPMQPVSENQIRSVSIIQAEEGEDRRQILAAGLALARLPLLISELSHPQAFRGRPLVEAESRSPRQQRCTDRCHVSDSALITNESLPANILFGYRM